MARRTATRRQHRQRHNPAPASAPTPTLPPAAEPVLTPTPEPPQILPPATQPVQPLPPAPPAPVPADPPSNPTPETPAPETAAPLLDAGFEKSFFNWNLAGVGDVAPSVVADIVRSGSSSCKVVLTGSQNRSELIFGGNGGGSTSGTVKFAEGDEYYYGFSFYIDSMVYGKPGAHNLIMQFKGNDSGSPGFGLMLWDYQGHRGLWSHGQGMGGDRFLAPIAEHEWHDVVIHFEVSRVGAGSYELYLDGALIDARSQTSMLVSGATYGYIKDGLYRNGGKIPGTSEIRLDAARLGTSFSSVAAS
ncbi:MAG: heparin lyase I family protein [Thermoleophilia bacterium]|nr:heparin lyase I family protein [Thermoleophilia bacterium]